MSFSLRATMLNVGLAAVCVGGWVTSSGWYLAFASTLFLLLILLSVASAILDTTNRPYWIGCAVVSCGVLAFSNHLPIIDAIAIMEDQKRSSMPPPLNYVPAQNAFSVPSSGGAVPYVSPQPSGVPGSQVPTVVLMATAPTPTWSFRAVTNVEGYTSVLRAFLVCSAAYFLGVLGGLACSKMYWVPQLGNANHNNDVHRSTRMDVP